MTSTNATPTLNAQPRTVLGKDVRFLRREGITPANLFGRRLDSVALQIETRSLQQAMTTGAAFSIVDLHVDGEDEPRAVLVRRIQRHPISRKILHVDLYQVDANRPVRTSVPVHLVGEAPAASLRDVIVAQEMYEIEIEALPRLLPNAIELDITSLTEPEQTISVGDLAYPEGVVAIADEGIGVIRSMYSRVAAEVAAIDVADAEAAEEAAPAEGDGDGDSDN